MQTRYADLKSRTAIAYAQMQIEMYKAREEQARALPSPDPWFKPGMNAATQWH